MHKRYVRTTRGLARTRDSPPTVHDAMQSNNALHNVRRRRLSLSRAALECVRVQSGRRTRARTADTALDALRYARTRHVRHGSVHALSRCRVMRGRVHSVA
jgi:hypothetical protein